MNYPTISEYVESIMLAEDNFDQLSSLRPVLDSYGNPVMSSGNFAVVFKMKDIDTGKFYAVKCFIKDQEGRTESYTMIADELKNVNSPYILPIRFLEKELFVDTSQSNETEFPVLVMDWVEGKTLDAYLRENLDNKYRLQVLSYRFCQMSAWLMSQPFAHGDLKPDNILVQENGSLVLVDYDGFYVPTMAGMEARELGSPDFRHPLRTPKDFNEHLDDFSIATIALSLKAISLDGQLYHTHAASDRLLLSANDYHDIGNSVAMQKIMQLASDTELSALLSTFYMASALKVLDKSHIKVFEIEMPAIILGEGKTILTQEDVKQANEKYGELVNVVIADSVTKINYNTFSRCESLKEVIISKSVESIGACAFLGCMNLANIDVDSNNKKFSSIGGVLFSKDKTTLVIFPRGRNGKYIIPNGVINVGDEAFRECRGLSEIEFSKSLVKIGDFAFKDCFNLTIVIIPLSVERIGYASFSGCSTLAFIRMPNSLVSIGDSAFNDCYSLVEITIPNSVASIGESVFTGCLNLKDIQVSQNNNNYISDNGVLFSKDKTCLKAYPGGKKGEYIIPNSVKKIAECAFYKCVGLTKCIIPNSVVEIDFCAFENCLSLIEIVIPNSVKTIGNASFYGCSNLKSVKISDSVSWIGSRVFSKCRNLINFQVDYCNEKYMSEEGVLYSKDGKILVAYPGGRFGKFVMLESVEEIWSGAFEGCLGLTDVYLPDALRVIGDVAFADCIRLSKVVIPNGVTEIYSGAFRECKSISKIEMSESLKIIEEGLFYGCTNLSQIFIPNSVEEIRQEAFRDCVNLVEIEFRTVLNYIWALVFKGCTSLNKIIIPKGSRQRFEELLGEEWHSKLVEK